MNMLASTTSQQPVKQSWQADVQDYFMNASHWPARMKYGVSVTTLNSEFPEVHSEARKFFSDKPAMDGFLGQFVKSPESTVSHCVEIFQWVISPERFRTYVI